MITEIFHCASESASTFRGFERSERRYSSPDAAQRGPGRARLISAAREIWELLAGPSSISGTARPAPAASAVNHRPALNHTHGGREARGSGGIASWAPGAARCGPAGRRGANEGHGTAAPRVQGPPGAGAGEGRQAHEGCRNTLTARVVSSSSRLRLQLQGTDDLDRLAAGTALNGWGRWV